MKTIVISDIHLGSKYSHAAGVLAFLRELPPDATLVLNGDTIDRWHKQLPPEHDAVIETLRALSLRQPVIWIPGNHDDTYTMPNPARIQFLPSYAIDRRLFVTHGHDFDNVMPHNRAFILLFRKLHQLRIWLGAESVHVAYYAKKFTVLYDFLCRNVRLNAVEHARENGYTAVTCGHTHHAEDAEIDGIRYLNTGSWTELQAHGVMVDDAGIRLLEIPTPRAAAEMGSGVLLKGAHP